MKSITPITFIIFLVSGYLLNTFLISYFDLNTFDEQLSCTIILAITFSYLSTLFAVNVPK